MQIAFLHARRPGSVDATLGAIVARMQRQGLSPVGVIQEPSCGGDRHRCEMDLIDIATGARLAINQPLGTGARGCRLDPRAVEALAARVGGSLGAGTADLLVVNRFGKLEATGRGFCPVIADALERGLPVLVGVNDLNRAAFDAFAAGLATELADEPEAVWTWLGARLKRVAA